MTDQEQTATPQEGEAAPATNLIISEDQFGNISFGSDNATLTAIEAIGMLNIAIFQLTGIHLQTAAAQTQAAVDKARGGLLLPAQPGRIIT